MKRYQLEHRAIELERAIANGYAQRQQLLTQADKVLTATIRLEGRLEEIREILTARQTLRVVEGGASMGR